MGKNKGGKSKQNPVFRVAGGKAAKAKAKFKAQPVNTNLKKVHVVMDSTKNILLTQTFNFFPNQLNANTRTKIESLDNSLGEVRQSLTAPPKKKEIIINETVVLPPADINQAIDNIASL